MRWSDEHIIGNNTRNNYGRTFDNNRKAKVMDDTIKRLDAIKAVAEYFSDDDDSHWNAIATYIIKDIPSAEKQGEWIDENNNIVPFDKDGCPRGWCKCSKCGDYLSASDEYAVRGFFCPNCGSRNRKEIE